MRERERGEIEREGGRERRRREERGESEGERGGGRERERAEESRGGKECRSRWWAYH